MGQEAKVAVVTDSVSSMRPEYPVVQELGVNLVPAEIIFSEGREIITYSEFEITPEELYRRMRESKRIPLTSGAITGPAIETYERLSSQTNSIISIHVTSKHSTAYDSAVNAAKHVMQQKPEVSIAVIDSKSVSLGIWFLAEQAAQLAQKGTSLEAIKQEILVTVPKIGLLAALATLENVIKGGRVGSLAGYLATLLQIKPILEVVDGEIKEAGRARTAAKARREIIDRIRGEKEEIVKMAVVHTNDLEAVEEVKQSLAQFYSKEIPIYEAGAALGVQAGEGTVAVIFQKAQNQQPSHKDNLLPS